MTSTSEDEFDENMEDEITFNAHDDNYGQNSLEDEENEGTRRWQEEISQYKKVNK